MRKLDDLSLTRIDGSTTTLGAYRGKVLLIVNVASKCGLTPQYSGLERLYEAKSPQGLEILGFPSNDFAGQEPGSEAEIATFCATSYDVRFPLFSKIAVKGTLQHPLYRALTEAKRDAIGEGPMREGLKGYGIDTGAPGEILWNFEKFLVDRSLTVVDRFAPDVTAEDSRLLSAVDRELAKTA
ncbi:MAG TPA: glutathione peroxidase [Steroidobacteraceae bacterium]|nr:glutathione peroxidase [Steroidobacteraceae bacterium]